MTTSLPSREIYAIDVPNPQNVKSTFVYNYFVVDEAVDQNAGVNSKYASVQQGFAGLVDSKTLESKVPRCIEITFKTAKVIDENLDAMTGDPYASSKQRTYKSGFIKDNVTKIMSEDDFSSYYYLTLDFRDAQIREKTFHVVSGTMSYANIVGSNRGSSGRNMSMTSLASSATNTTPSAIDSTYVSTAVNVPSECGVNYATQRERMTTQALYDDLSAVTVTTHVNAKFVSSIVENLMRDPLNVHDVDLMQEYVSMKNVQEMARSHMKSSVISADEYKTSAEPVSVQSGAANGSKKRIELLGYLIEKTEIRQDGSTITHPTIILEGSWVNSMVDCAVRYYSTYVYTVKTVSLVTIPSVMEELGELVNAQFMIASRPVSTTCVCVENVPPPAVADLNFTWNYEVESLLIHWSFPPNTQRDIKKFQVYRRTTIDEPFRLLKMYDFDDATVKALSVEEVSTSLVDVVENPVLCYVDKKFTKQSKFIYAVTCVDAHGLLSNYSAQFELTFDTSKNKIVKRLISHAGAPRSYPNMFLEADAFVDTICDGPGHDVPKTKSGPHSRLSIYFTPECYNVVQSGKKIPVVKSMQVGGKYRLQLLNIDNQKQQIIDLYVDDKRSS